MEGLKTRLEVTDKGKVKIAIYRFFASTNCNDARGNNQEKGTERHWTQNRMSINFSFVNKERKLMSKARMMQRGKREIAKRLDHLTGVKLNDENLVKAISRVVSVARYVTKVRDLMRGDIEELCKIVKTTLRKQGFLGKQASDERLYGIKEDGGRGLKSFKEVYDEIKVRVACYMVTSNNEWIKVSWRNEHMKKQTSL